MVIDMQCTHILYLNCAVSACLRTLFYSSTPLKIKIKITLKRALKIIIKNKIKIIKWGSYTTEQGKSCVKGFWTTYLGTRGNPVLNRACMHNVLKVSKQFWLWGIVQLDKVRAKLLKFKFSIHHHKGVYLSSTDIIQSIFRVGFKYSGFPHKKESYTKFKGIIKKMKWKPKSKGSRWHVNSGPAKARLSYAVRGLGVAVKRNGVSSNTRITFATSLWSSPVFKFFRQHSTGTGCSTNVVSRLNDLNTRSKEYPQLPIDRDLYKTFILNKDIYLIAYNRLISKPGFMTPEFYNSTPGCLSSYFISSLITELKSESFTFSLRNRIVLDKANGGNRPISKVETRDKLVQEVMRLVLEAIYEPIFKETSFGFRPKRGCHTALRYVFTKFKGCALWIEGDITGCFDNIPHDKLMAVLSVKIKDQRFLQLVRKVLNAGYMLNSRPVYDIVKKGIGIPQGSIISPILVNIYLHQLDEFVDKLKPEFDMALNRKRKPRVSKLKWLQTKAKRVGLSKSVRNFAVELRNNPNKFVNSDNTKLMYVRYADDWIIAINGKYSDAKDILGKVAIFLNDIGLRVSPTKTKITNTYVDRALFLGTNIAHSKASFKKDTINRRGFLKRKAGFLILSAPMSLIYKTLRDGGFMSKHRGKTIISWLRLEIRQIIIIANSILRGYDNYYSFVLNKGKFSSYIYYIIRDVVLRTLAHKLSLSSRQKVIKKYGPEISIYDHNKRDINKKPKLVTKLYKPSYRFNIWKFKTKYVYTNVKEMYAKIYKKKN